MPKQLNLWPAKEEHNQEVWQSLEQSLQDQIKTSLARLIRKMLCAKEAAPTNGKEANDDHS